tara:strand:- start:36 stop:854 length:819 start_codon:yes stop_codon:yes gene_type:complete
MNTCQICQNKSYKESTYTYKCEKCSFIFSKLKSGTGRDIIGLENLRRKNFKKIIFYLNKIYPKNLKKKLILEIGSGDGFFIDECEKKNLKIYGSEANLKDYKYLKKRFKKIYFINFNKKINLGKFDIIVFNDVFEHLKNLNIVIKNIKSLLKKNGIVILNLPSSDGIVYKISKILYKLNIKNFYDRLWQKNQSSPHLSYFNSENLSKLFKGNNFNLILNARLNTVDINKNFKRANSVVNNIFISFLLSLLMFIFFFIQKLFKPDIILLLFKK